jgi:hypothetical protein
VNRFFLIVSVRLKRRYSSLSPGAGTRKEWDELAEPIVDSTPCPALELSGEGVGSGFRHLAHVLYLIETV